MYFFLNVFFKKILVFIKNTCNTLSSGDVDSIKLHEVVADGARECIWNQLAFSIWLCWWGWEGYLKRLLE